MSDSAAAAFDPEIPPFPPGVRLTTLSNGLTIIVREDHSAPVVSAQAWCKTGSIHEGNWMGAGLSHVLEHMLFKGTTNRAASRIDQEVQDAGGYMNAYTSFDRTVYWINVPNTGASVALDILCDIMQNATLPDDELEKEKQVILREMDMNQDDPGRRSSRRLFETAFVRSPYRYTIIGYPDIFNELRREDIVGYYLEKYAPNNIFFVVVGDIDGDEVIAQIQEAFAGKKAKPLSPPALCTEPRQAAPHELAEEAPIELAHVHFSWHIPETSHPDTPALDVLATVLGSGRSSRFYQAIREKQGLVNSISAWTYNPGELGVFGVSATLDAGNYGVARTAILKQIELLKTELVPAHELSKVVKQFIASTLGTRKTMEGQAHDLGNNWLTASDLNFSERYLAAVKCVTSADLQRVALQYLSTENRTIFALMPSGTMPRTVQAEESLAKTPIRKFELANGLRLLVKEDHRLPFVEVRAAFKGGVLAETPETNGLAYLTSKLLLKGTASRTAEQIAIEIESLGGSIDSFSGNNSFGVNVEALSGDFDTGLRLLADVVLNPAFPEAAVEREKEIQLAFIRAQKDQLLQSAFRAMRRSMFGETAYGLDILGGESTVADFQASDLLAHHRRLAVPNNCVLAIFGDINTDEVYALVEQTFGEWQRAGTVLEKLPAPARLSKVKRASETRDKMQAVLAVGFPGVDLHDPDRYALELLQEACSDLGSRLFVRIRENLGLAYYVGAQHFLGLLPGYFAFYVGTMPEKAALVEEELLKEAALLRTDGLTEEELKRAKAKLIGQKKIARQDLGDYAQTAALDELYGLGFEFSDMEDSFLEAVTVKQVQEAAKKYLRPEAFAIAIIKPDEAPERVIATPESILA